MATSTSLYYELHSLALAKREYLAARSNLVAKMRLRLAGGVTTSVAEVRQAWELKQQMRTRIRAAHAWLRSVAPTLISGLGIRMTAEVYNIKADLDGNTRAYSHLRQKLGLPRLTQEGYCSCCGSQMLTTATGSWGAAKITICTICAETGAVQSIASKSWYASAQAMEEAEQVKLVWLVTPTELERTQVIVKDVQNNKLITRDGAEITIDNEPVYYKSGLLLSYHSGQEVPQYDDSPIRVGTELEVNMASGNRQNKDVAIARVLLATRHAVKVERDGSVTGFEIVTGHGSPASLRNVLTPIFTGECLDGYSVSTRTGAHVHATNPFHGTRDGTFEDCRSLGKAFAPMRPVYEKIAGRSYTTHAREGVSANRYSALAWRENLGTLEYRLFKMQMSLPKLMRNLGFAWAVTQYMGQAGLAPAAEPSNTSLDGFIEFIGDLPREQTIELRVALAFHGYKVPNDMKAYRKMYRDLGLRTAVA